MSKKILVIGSINKDLVITTPRFPKEGETILGNNFYTANGGKGANQACAIGKLGGNVAMLGAIGNDNFGKDLSNALYSNNVNIDNLLMKNDVSTGIAVITVTNDGANHIIVAQGANALITKDDIKEKLIASFDIIVMQLEIPLKLDRDFLSCVDILIPNETEIDIIGGVDYVLECGVKNIILTLGADGCELITRQNRKHFDAYKVNVVDTTAAGDSFLGGVVRMIADDKTIEEAIEFATKVSNITVTRKGAIDSIPTYNEVIDNY